MTGDAEGAASDGICVLLEFLMGSSIDDIKRRHRLCSAREAEALIRAVLLSHGYASADETA